MTVTDTNDNVSPAGGAAGFPARAAAIATREWDRFGRQTYDIDGHRDHAGHSEGEDGFYQRIGEYWLDGTGTHGIDGRDHDQYWSAAFISWVMKSAGAGDRFRTSTQHSVYIFQGIRDFLRKREEAGYWTVRLNAEKPAIGDLVCWSRQTGIDYDHQDQGDYPGHTDVVVEIGADRLFVIGGNVGDSVTRRPLPLDSAGFVKPFTENGEDLFALMKCRIA